MQEIHALYLHLFFSVFGKDNVQWRPDLLVKAWNTWKTLPPSAIDAKRPLDWGRAIAAADAQYEFTAIVEAALKDTAHAPDFQMLKLAVVVLQDTEPERAIELLKTAQQLCF